MENVYLITGANQGDRMLNLETASRLINEKCGTIIRSSSFYETAAWGKTDQQDFLNQVLCIQTILDPVHLLQIILEIEMGMGRLRMEKYGPRIIDIDILFYGNHIVQLENLNIPHPRLQDRRFVLEPLQEIAGSFIHPVLLKTISRLSDECKDPLDVRKL